MKQTAENKAAEAPAPFYVDYKSFYMRNYTAMKRNLERPGMINRAAGVYIQYRDHRTVVVHGGRQTGKTFFIRQEAGPTDVVVCMNLDFVESFNDAGPSSFKKLFEGDAGKVLTQNVVSVKSLVEDRELAFENAPAIRRVFVDDALCCFDRHGPASIYKAILRLLPHLDHIVLVG